MLSVPGEFLLGLDIDLADFNINKGLLNKKDTVSRLENELRRCSRIWRLDGLATMIFLTFKKSIKGKEESMRIPYEPSGEFIDTVKEAGIYRLRELWKALRHLYINLQTDNSQARVLLELVLENEEEAKINFFPKRGQVLIIK